MRTIEQENQKLLREHLDVQIGLEEISTDNVFDDTFNVVELYRDNAKENEIDDFVRTMEFANGGFLLDGKSMPLTTNEIDGKYGLIASSLADENGDIENPPTIDIHSTETLEEITIQICDHDGNSELLSFFPEWEEFEEGYVATITLGTFTPYERMHILRIVNGKSWIFDNSTSIKANVILRSVDTSINPELQASEIEVVAYQPDDFTAVIGQMTEGAPIWYRAGYKNEMSPVRRFYLSEKLDWQDNQLVIKGQDATMFIDGSYDGYWSISTENQEKRYAKAIEGIIMESLGKHNIQFDVIGQLPETAELTNKSVFLDNASRRKHIANAVNLYRGDYRIDYVDAGNPRISYEDNSKHWVIYNNQITPIKQSVEFNVSKVEGNLLSYSLSAEEELQTVDVVNGQYYFVDSSEPIGVWRISGGQIADIETVYSIKIKATTTGTATIYGKKIIGSSVLGDSPYTKQGSIKGITKSIEDGILLNSSRQAIDELLNRQNIVYEFTYRGNPYIDPRDTIEIRDVINENVLFEMTVDSVSHEHENGGYKSDIVARKGVV